MCEEKRKRKIITQIDTLTSTVSTDYITDEECKKMVKQYATAYKISEKQIFVFDLGTEEEVENGTMFFCPKCGSYNQYGWDPQVNQFYTQPKDGGPAVPTGYYKYVSIDCDDCGTFELSCDKFNEEMEKLSKEFKQHENSRSDEKVEGSD